MSWLSDRCEFSKLVLNLALRKFNDICVISQIDGLCLEGIPLCDESDGHLRDEKPEASCVRYDFKELGVEKLCDKHLGGVGADMVGFSDIAGGCLLSWISYKPNLLISNN